MRRKSAARRSFRIEELEPRLVLSISFDSPTGDDAVVAADARGNAGGATAPAIRLDLVALHELGHALGLDHSSNPNSIMYAYYNANYNLSNFSIDSPTPDPVISTLQTLYADVNASPWKDSLDSGPNDVAGRVDLTYSFMLDGAKMDSGKTNSLSTTFNALFPGVDWKQTFVYQLSRWASVSGPDTAHPHLAFSKRDETTVLAFNYSGAAQNDSRSGDIRIGAHRFDGAGKVLAHAYFPPPNGSTAAGDAHFDLSEKWVLASGVSSTTSSSSTTGGSGWAARLRFGHSTEASDLGVISATSTVASDTRTTSTVTAPQISTVDSSLAADSVTTLSDDLAKTVNPHSDLVDANQNSSNAVDLAFAAIDLPQLLAELDSQLAT